MRTYYFGGEDYPDQVAPRAAPSEAIGRLLHLLEDGAPPPVPHHVVRPGTEGEYAMEGGGILDRRPPGANS